MNGIQEVESSILFVSTNKTARLKPCGFVISTDVDMEKLILDMMTWANVTEKELYRKGEIETAFGETLSWEYLSYVRTHPTVQSVTIEILYGENDNLTSREIIEKFAMEHNANLTVMMNGEHWFHTEEQLAFLDGWMSGAI